MDVIPPLNEIGYLPPGIHPATLDEIEEAFGESSPERRELMHLSDGSSKCAKMMMSPA